MGNAVYAQPEEGRRNVAQYEFIPWVLSQCATLDEAKGLLEEMNLTGTPYSDRLPAAQLHWIIADRSGAITVESVADGLKIYENPVGVLTNNPPFEQQMFGLNAYMHLSPKQPENQFAKQIDLKPYSRGMGAIGLPGDLSSSSRFVRVAFVKLHAVSGTGEPESVGQFFHILGAVDQQRGCCEVAEENMRSPLYFLLECTERDLLLYHLYEPSDYGGGYAQGELG